MFPFAVPIRHGNPVRHPERSSKTLATTARFVLAALLVLGPIACGGGDAADDSAASATVPGADAAGDGADHQIATVYAPDLGIDIGRMAALPSGLHMRDLEVGSGEIAVTGRTVRVIYTGWLPNGVEFDSNMDGQPMAFVLGVGDAMAGWEEGITGMRAGGRRSLVIPPALGYGERGLPGVIPPNSTLIYDIRLEEVIVPDTTSTGQ